MRVVWKCPVCKRTHYGDSDLVMKVCYCCQVEMEVQDAQGGYN